MLLVCPALLHISLYVHTYVLLESVLTVFEIVPDFSFELVCYCIVLCFSITTDAIKLYYVLL